MADASRGEKSFGICYCDLELTPLDVPYQNRTNGIKASGKYIRLNPVKWTRDKFVRDATVRSNM